MDDLKLLAIDPEGCGCTECLIGEYVPVNHATAEQILMLARGELQDNTFDTAYVIYTDYNGVGISFGPHRFDYPTETVDSLPPRVLGFERVNVEFEPECWKRALYTL